MPEEVATNRRCTALFADKQRSMARLLECQDQTVYEAFRLVLQNACRTTTLHII